VRAVIRFLSRGIAGTVEQRDKIFEGDAITLGRATDQVLHLKDRRVGLKAARIFRRGDRVLITSNEVAGVIVNGLLCKDAALGPGDEVSIGSNTLHFFEPPAGFDVAFTFELDASARTLEAVRERPLLQLAETRLAKRRWSWILFVIIALACLVVPALGVKQEALRGVLRAGPWPDDRLWSSGPLAAVHQNLSTTCESCHAEPFVRVKNQACLECHAATLHQHAAADVRIERLQGERCTACHLEHNEPPSLVRRDARLCADCHANLEGVLGRAHDSGAATDFATAHPEFRLTILDELSREPPSWRPPRWRRVKLEDAAGAEHSGLIFPHDVHLTAEGIKAPTGSVVMKCGDCHQPEEGGARMQAIRMEQHCESCHRLDFEPADPERTVPHGDPDRVLQTLVEYYSARYLEDYPDPHATARPSRSVARPGVALDPAARAYALELARAKALATARDLFERRTCHQCHAVAASVDENGAPRWSVAPAVLTREWMPKAHFDHARHSTALTSCETCHAAGQSKAAADVLMPGIKTCRECHGGSSRLATAQNLVPSDCTLCHSFHIPTNELWADVGRIPTGATTR
jgi:predicted CXXCH cytochrome family protein